MPTGRCARLTASSAANLSRPSFYELVPRASRVLSATVVAERCRRASARRPPFRTIGRRVPAALCDSDPAKSVQPVATAPLQRAWSVGGILRSGPGRCALVGHLTGTTPLFHEL